MYLLFPQEFLVSLDTRSLREVIGMMTLLKPGRYDIYGLRVEFRCRILLPMDCIGNMQKLIQQLEQQTTEQQR